MMSKARVEVVDLGQALACEGTFRVDGLLNPADLPADVRVSTFRLVNVRPVPLLEGAVFEGPYWRVKKHALGEDRTTDSALLEHKEKDTDDKKSRYIDLPRGMLYRFPPSSKKPSPKRKPSPNKAEKATKPRKTKGKE
jgi:hypothetical protein